MATGELVRREIDRGRAAYWAFGVVAALGLAVVLLGLRRPPQMGADERVFGTVDALYTAVRLRDAAKVARCEERLRGYRAAGHLPDDAAGYLDGVIASARGGNWPAAAERLYDFMKSQRRDGAADPPKRAKNATAKRR